MGLAVVRNDEVGWTDNPLTARIEAMRRVLERSTLKRDAQLTSIYCIQEGDDGPIKIGHSDATVASRMKAMQTGNSRPLRLLASAVLPRRLEHEIHNELTACRIGRSEWFQPTADTREVVAALRAYSVADAQTVRTTQA